MRYQQGGSEKDFAVEIGSEKSSGFIVCVEWSGQECFTLWIPTGRSEH